MYISWKNRKMEENDDSVSGNPVKSIMMAGIINITCIQEKIIFRMVWGYRM